MAGTFRIGGKVLATHDSGTDEISLDSATNTSNMSFDANHAGIKTALNASGDAPVYACRAWVNFNGTGTVAIRESGNVSSITDNGGNGYYTVNFTTAMPDQNASLTCTTGDDTPNTSRDFIGTGRLTSTSAAYISVYSFVLSSAVDAEWVSVAVFR